MINKQLTIDKYPRVTEIIRATETAQEVKKLMAWIAKMEKIHGKEKAEKNRQEILDNGTALHLSIAKYLADDIIEPLPHKKLPTIKPFLDLVKLSPRLIIEKRLYSHKYKFTGQPDLICTFNDVITIIDWTTSQRLKKKPYVARKFIQAGAYAIAVEETLNIKIKQLAVVTIVDNPNTYQIFTEDPKEWRLNFLARLGKYHSHQKINS